MCSLSLSLSDWFDYLGGTWSRATSGDDFDSDDTSHRPSGQRRYRERERERERERNRKIKVHTHRERERERERERDLDHVCVCY